MATNFDFLGVRKGLKPNTPNTPIDIRTRVNTLEDMANIPDPFEGMQVYVVDTQTTYQLTADVIKPDEFGDLLINVSDKSVFEKLKVTTTQGMKDYLQGSMDEIKNDIIKDLGETVTGNPGPGTEVRYCLGNSSEPYESVINTDRYAGGQNAWTLTRPVPSASDEYVYSITARIKYADVNDTVGVLDGVWSDPVVVAGGVGGKDFRVLGVFESVAALESAVTAGTVPTPTAGDAYAIGTSEPYKIYIWDGVLDMWKYIGEIQGAKGDDAAQTITKFIFTSSEDEPKTPQGGEMNFGSGVFTAPTGWTTNSDSLKSPIWMSSKTFSTDDRYETSWAYPVELTGKDGDSAEFIYFTTAVEQAPKNPTPENYLNDASYQVPEWTPTKSYVNKYDEVISEVNALNWSDNPKGVSKDVQFEYVSVRKPENGVWGEFSDPVLWSKFGVNGNDGAGVEYIYILSNSQIPTFSNPTPAGDITTNAEYQKPEWRPAFDEEADTNWTDSPTGVNGFYRYEFVSVRRQDSKGVWGRFSDPVVWANFAKNGDTTLVAMLDSYIDSVLLDADGKVDIAASGFPITTTFHVFKGHEELKVTNLVASEPSADIDSSLTIKDTPDGTLHGIYTIPEGAMKDSNNSKVNIPLTATVIDDDGEEVSYTCVFKINKLSASSPNIVADFSNDNVTIPATTTGAIDSNIVVDTMVMMARGTENLVIDSVVKSNESEISVEDSYSNGMLTITIKNMTADRATVYYTVTGHSSEDANNKYTKVISIAFNKIKAGTDAEIYSLVPDSNVIYFDGSTYNPDTLNVSISYTKGADTTILKPSELNGLVVYYSVDKNDYTASETYKVTDAGLSIKDLRIDRYVNLFLIDPNSDGLLVDKERIYLLHDGTPGKDAVNYELVASRKAIQYDKNGNLTDTSVISCALVIKEGDKNPIELTSVPAGYEIYYTKDGGSKTVYDLGTTFDPLTIEDNISFYLVYEGGESDIVLKQEFIGVTHSKGDRGDAGKIIYPAGIWSADKTYVSDDRTMPYVYDKVDNSYWYLLEGTYNAAVSPSKSYANDPKTSPWREIKSLDVMYSAIGIFDQALVGPAVFYGDYVFSQMSKEGNSNYTDFDPANPSSGSFIPALCFNYKSGEVWLNGKVTFGNDVKIGTNNIDRFDEIISGRLEGYATSNDLNVAAEAAARALLAAQSASDDAEGAFAKASAAEAAAKAADNLASSAAAMAQNASAAADAAAEAADAASSMAQNAKDLAEGEAEKLKNWGVDGWLSVPEQRELLVMEAQMSSQYEGVEAIVNEFNGIIDADDSIKSADKNNFKILDNSSSKYGIYKNTYNASTSIIDNNTQALERYSSQKASADYNNIFLYWDAYQNILDEISTKKADYAEYRANTYSESVYAEFDSRIAAAQAAAEAAAAESELAVTKADAAATNVTNLQTSISNLQSNVNGLSSAKEELEESLRKQAQDLQDAIANGATAEEIEALTNQINDTKDLLDETSEALKNAKSDLQQQIDDLNQAIEDEKDARQTAFNNLNNAINGVSSSLGNKYDAEIESLQKQIDDAITQGDLDAVTELMATKKELEDEKTERQGALINILDYLGLAYNADGTPSEYWGQIDGGLSVGDVNELIYAATVEGISFDESEGSLSAEKVFANKIVALIGKFGTIDAAHITGGVIDASHINVDGLTVTTLNTRPEATGDKIVASDNELRIVANDGSVAAVLSSNEITPTTGDDLTMDWDDTGKNLFTTISFTRNASNGKYLNNTRYESDYKEIGLMEDGGTVDFTIIAGLTNSTNSLQPQQDIAETNWSFTDGNPSTTWVVGGGSSVLSYFGIVVEKYNTSTGSWNEYKILTNRNNMWTGCTALGTTGTAGTKYWKKTTYSFEAGTRGVYRFKTVLHENGILSSVPARMFSAMTKGTVNRNITASQYTEIGKNGIVVKAEGDTIFYVCNDEIVMQVGNSGIKITNDGIYKRSGGSWGSWS